MITRDNGYYVCGGVVVVVVVVVLVVVVVVVLGSSSSRGGCRLIGRSISLLFLLSLVGWEMLLITR